jgi:putative transposase
MDDQALTKPYSLDLRDRAVARVVAGETVRSVAAALRGRFERREMAAALSRYGQRGAEKEGGHRPRVLIGEHRAWLLQRIASGPDMTLRGLAAELAEPGVKVSYRTVWNREQSWLGLFEQFFRFDKWNACRVQAAAICDSRLK